MKKQRVSVVGTVLTIEYPSIGQTFSADYSLYPQAIQADALQHGYKQKFGDAESGGTAEDKFAHVQLIHASLLEGEWNLTGARDTSAIIIEAVCNLKKKKLASVQKVVAEFPDRINEWKTNARVKSEVARIRAERAAKAAEGSDEIDIKL